MSRTFISTAALADVLSAAPALAQQTPKTASIRIDDLDLSNGRDQRVLSRRVAVAKESVCGSYAGAREDELARIGVCRASVDRQLEPRLAARRAKGRMVSR